MKDLTSISARRAGRKSIARAGIIFFVVASLSCSKADVPTGPKPTHITVSPPSLSMAQNTSATLTVSVTDEHDQPISATVSFQSSNTQIVTVSTIGVVQSAGPAGTANVTVSAGSASAVVPVTVTGVPSGITVTPDPIVVAQTKTVQLDAHVTDANGAVVQSPPQITYKSGNTAIVTVSATGVVAAVGPAGATNITVSSGALSKTVNASVTAVATALVITPSSLAMGTNSNVTMSASIVDAIGQPMTTPAVTWSLSATNVVTVSAAGVVTSGSTVGTATLTATAGTFTKTAPVTVVPLAHPAGTVYAKQALTGAWGIGISTNDIAFVPKFILTGVGRVALPSTTVALLAPTATGLGVAFNAAGTVAYVANLDSGRVDVLDGNSGAVTGALDAGAPGSVYAAIVSPDGQSLYVSQANQQIVQINLQTGTKTASIALPGIANAISRHPAQSFIYVSVPGAGVVQEISTQTNIVTRTFTVGGAAQESAVSPDGKTLWIAQEGGALYSFDLGSGAQTGSYAGAGGFGLAISRDGLQVWVTTTGTTVHIFDVAAHTVQNFSVQGGSRRIVFSKDGLTAIITSTSGGVDFVH